MAVKKPSVPFHAAALLALVGVSVVAARARSGDAARPAQEAAASTQITMHIPPSLKIEHDELHAQLAALVREKGEVGAAATDLARLLYPHFDIEEEVALPLLGLLPAVASGSIAPGLKPSIDASRRLKSELPGMLAEHRAILTALDGLSAAASRARRADVAAFAEKLKLHARTEEEVLYPAAIVVGEFVDAKLNPRGR